MEQNRKEDEMLEEANTRLEQLKLVRILFSWREYVSLRVAQRTSEEKARLHHNSVVQAKCFISWYEHHRLQLRKRLLQRQGAWFEHNRLLSFTYSKWRIQVSPLFVPRMVIINHTEVVKDHAIRTNHRLYTFVYISSSIMHV